MRGRVLVLGGGVVEILEAARRLELEVIFVQRTGADTPALEKLAHEWHVASFEDHQAMLRFAQQTYARAPFDCVLSFTELGLIPAALIAERLALPGASTVRTARLLRDKSAMRACLNRADFSLVQSQLCHDLEEARHFANIAGYPVILKPRDGSGSIGVCRVDSPADLPAAIAASTPDHPAGILVEEFLAGAELSVEAFSFEGHHLIVAVTGKQVTDNYVESGHVVPAMIHPADRERLAGFVSAFLDLVGVTDGPSHTEVILTEKGPRIVESHDRLGGDKIFRLVQLAYGVDLVSWCYEWPLRLMSEPAPPESVGAGCIRYLLPKPGRVSAISCADTLRRDEELDHYELAVSVGDVVRPLRCSLDRAGFVVASGSSPQDAITAANRLASSIRIETTPVEDSDGA